MECRKCCGLMIEEWLADELDEAYVWRCVNCGSVMDLMIEHNHQHRMGAVPTASCGKS
jgi:uncharacterized Zn finger protein